MAGLLADQVSANTSAKGSEQAFLSFGTRGSVILGLCSVVLLITLGMSALFVTFNDIPYPWLL
jgi:hypothetical protein